MAVKKNKADIVDTPTDVMEKKVVERKTMPKLTDDILVRVRSVVFGQLIYINHRTGEKTIWSGYGDEQILTMNDLRAMKAGNATFFESNWIHVVGIETDGFEEVTPEDVYSALFVQKYYKDVLNLSDYSGICEWSEKEIQEKVPMFSDSSKINLIVALNEYIEEGRLDSLKKIKKFEELLGCELKRAE